MKRKKKASSSSFSAAGAAKPQAPQGREGKPSPEAPAKEPLAAGEQTAAKTAWRERGMLVFFPVLLFLSMTVQTVAMSLVLAGLALALSIGKGPLAALRSRLGVPVVGLLGFLLLCTVASLTSHFGRYAIGEFVKILASGSVALVLLCRGRRGQGRPLLWGFSAVCGGIALLCNDAGCNGPLFRAFTGLMARLGSDYSGVAQVMYAGDRFNGIYADANLTGSLLALGMLAGLYLVHTAEKREKPLACLLLGLSSTGFLLAMSRGAILCFAAALVVYLAAEGKGRRLSLFFLMVSAALSAFVFSVPAFSLLSAGSALGTAVTVPCGLAIWLTDTMLFQPLAQRLCVHRRWMAAGLGALAALLAVTAAAALSLTKPYAFEGYNGELYRVVSVEPGASYTLSSDHDGAEAARAIIFGADRVQTMLKQQSTYYDGPLDGANFTVPEGVTQVHVRIYGPEGGQLRSLTLSDGREIPTSYTLLPRNIIDRLQGDFFQDYSFLLRVQYLKDGWTLFTQSPLLGHGLGSTEGLLTSVQPFYYESLYLHNHILQVLAETGLLGLAAFLSLMLGAAWLLVRQLRREADPMAAALLACLAMMNLHGLMELSFSVRMFQCAAFFLAVLVVVEYAPAREGKRGLAWAAMGSGWLWLAVSGALVLGSVTAQNRYWAIDANGMDIGEFLDTMEDLDRMDCYTDMDYKINRMVNSLQQGGSGHRETAALCARQLVETGDFDACYQAAAYYYLPLGRLPEFFRTVETGLMQERSNQDAWNSAFNLYRQAVAQLAPEAAETFARGVAATGQKLSDAREALISSIELSQENQLFLAVAQTVEAEGLEGQAAASLLLPAAQPQS